MKKYILVLALILGSILSHGQTWLPVGNTLQRSADGTGFKYRFSLGSPGFYNISDSIRNALMFAPNLSLSDSSSKAVNSAFVKQQGFLNASALNGFAKLQYENTFSKDQTINSGLSVSKGVSYRKYIGVYFGNSIVAGANASTTDLRWTTLSASNLGVIENNQGISGSTMQKGAPIDPFGGINAVDRMTNIPTKDDLHSFLVFSIGINDIGYNGSDYDTVKFKRDYRLVLNYALSKGWTGNKIVIVAPSYIGNNGKAFYATVNGGNGQPSNARIAQYTIAAQQIATEYNALFVDYKPMIIANGGDALFSPDGIHPLDIGHKLISEYVTNFIRTNIFGSALTINGATIINGDAEITKNAIISNSSVGSWGVDTAFSRFGHHIFYASSSSSGFMQKNNGENYINGPSLTISSPTNISNTNSSFTLNRPTLSDLSGVFNSLNGSINWFSGLVSNNDWRIRNYNTGNNPIYIDNTNDKVTFSGGIISQGAEAVFQSGLSSTAINSNQYFRIRSGISDVGYITTAGTWGASGTNFSLGASTSALDFYTNNSTTLKARLQSDGTLNVSGNDGSPTAVARNSDLSPYQLVSNLSSDLTSSSTKYPSVNAVNTSLALKANLSGGNTFTGVQTTNTSFKVSNLSSSFSELGFRTFSTFGIGQISLSKSNSDGSATLSTTTISPQDGVTGSVNLKTPLTGGTLATVESVGTGWAQYASNAYTSGSPLVITAGNTTALANNGNTSITTQLPIGVTSFLNTSTGKILAQNDGDFYNIEVRFKAKSSSPNGRIKVGINIGGTQGVIREKRETLSDGVGVEQLIAIPMMVYSGSTFVANGGAIEVTSLVGDTTIYDVVFVIDRTHKAR